MNTRQRKSNLKQYKNACNLLAAAVNEQLFEGCRDWYWIGDKAGGVCDFDGCDTFSPDDMLIIIEKDVTYEQYADWRNAGLEYNDGKEECQQKWINLDSWLMGARYEMFDNVAK